MKAVEVGRNHPQSLSQPINYSKEHFFGPSNWPAALLAQPIGGTNKGFRSGQRLPQSIYPLYNIKEGSSSSSFCLSPKTFSVQSFLASQERLHGQFLPVLKSSSVCPIWPPVIWGSRTDKGLGWPEATPGDFISYAAPVKALGLVNSACLWSISKWSMPGITGES